LTNHMWYGTVAMVQWLLYISVTQILHFPAKEGQNRDIMTMEEIRKYTSKEVNRQKLLDYLGDPNNDFPNRKVMNDVVLGYDKSAQYIYKIFNVQELCEIEKEGLALRRTKYSPGIAKVDRALILKALEGDTAAIKLCYQRFEDWGETSRITGKDGKELAWTTEIIDPKLNVEDKF